MTKEEIKNRANQLNTTSYRGIDMVSLACLTTFAQHISELTMQETIESVCEILDEMTVVPKCVVDELYAKAKTKAMEK